MLAPSRILGDPDIVKSCCSVEVSNIVAISSIERPDAVSWLVALAFISSHIAADCVFPVWARHATLVGRYQVTAAIGAPGRVARINRWAPREQCPNDLHGRGQLLCPLTGKLLAVPRCCSAFSRFRLPGQISMIHRSAALTLAGLCVAY
jgi:hypothetical protein